MQHSFRAPGFYSLMLMFVLAMSLATLGCDDDDFRDVRTRELEGRSFFFPDARAFELTGQQVTISFGTFGLGANPMLAPFSLTASVGGVNTGTASGEFFVEAEGNFLAGGIDLNPESTCDLNVAASNITGFPVGKRIRFDPCDVDNTTGALRLENDSTGSVSISNPNP